MLTRTMAAVSRATLTVLTIASVWSCGPGDDACDACYDYAEGIANFPSVQRDAGTSRAVSTLRVGEVATICMLGPCGCTPSYDLNWVVGDPSVASIAGTSQSLDVCNEAVGVSPIGSAQRTAALTGLRPGETTVWAVVTVRGSSKTVPAVHCFGDRAQCREVILRVVP
jgi:hypothetical protein